ncbi:MAG: hypothetical protein WBC55_01995 [Dehalococcoidia bacterium]
MDWSNIFPILFALLLAVGLPLAFRSLKKGGQNKVDELYQHLQGIGVKASVLEKDASQKKTKRKRSWGQRLVGTIKLTDYNIDSIDVVGVASQYGVNYYLDFLVNRPSFMGGSKKKKTKMNTKKSSLFKGKVIDIEWKGDDFLAQRLNFDYGLKDKLLQADLSALKGGISIYYEPKREYARIRTNYFLPTPDLFEATDMIANHVKSWY